MGVSLPYYRPLTDENVKQIDQTGRRILERIGIGVRVDDSTFLDTLKRAGAQVDYDNQRVRFSGDWLDEVLGRAPSHFTLYSQDGQMTSPWVKARYTSVTVGGCSAFSI